VRRDAAAAAPVENHFVVVDLKPVCGEVFDFGQTPVHVEHTIAGSAHEMMMMRAARQLVAGTGARDLDLGQKSFVGKKPHIAVDGGDAQRWYIALPLVEDFFRAQGPSRIFEDLANRTALACLSLHP